MFENRVKRRIAALKGDSSPQFQARRKSAKARLQQAQRGRARTPGWRLREQLAQANIRLEVWSYLALSLGLAGAVGGLLLLLALPPLWAGLGAVILGIGVPKLVVTVLARRRLGRFTNQFADAIDVVVRGIRSGLPLGECVAIVGREMADPLGAEFRQVYESQRLGLTLHEALARAVERMPTPELRYFATVTAIQQQTGGNLADTLSKLSDILRARKRMRDKVQALASEARTSAWIIGSLPVLVMLVLTVTAPKFVGILFHTSTGHVLLFVGGMTMAVGAVVMAKMIHFDV
ncbi:MAG TPA: type II secretion system F family protein [Magnetospirillum sp.]|nr:type II secretion system F family protein [Magnetospirillum sp.]